MGQPTQCAAIVSPLAPAPHVWQWHEWHGSRDPDTASLVGFHRIDGLRSLAWAGSSRPSPGWPAGMSFAATFNPSGRLGVRAASAPRHALLELRTAFAGCDRVG